MRAHRPCKTLVCLSGFLKHTEYHISVSFFSNPGLYEYLKIDPKKCSTDLCSHGKFHKILFSALTQVEFGMVEEQNVTARNFVSPVAGFDCEALLKETPCRLTVVDMGRLGNQLFEYAVLYILQRKTGRIACISEVWITNRQRSIKILPKVGEFYTQPCAISAVDVVEFHFQHAHSRSPACLSSTFFFPPLTRKGNYKPAGQPRLKWAKLAEKGKNKRWFVEFNDSWHFKKSLISTP